MEASLSNHRRNYTLHFTSDGFIPPRVAGSVNQTLVQGSWRCRNMERGQVCLAELANYTLTRHSRAPTHRSLPLLLEIQEKNTNKSLFLVMEGAFTLRWC